MSKALASKADLTRAIAASEKRVLGRLDATTGGIMGEIMGIKQYLEQMTQRMDAQVNDLKLYFDIRTEQLVHDFRGGFNDKVEVFNHDILRHDRRIKRLERHVGFIR